MGDDNVDVEGALENGFFEAVLHPQDIQCCRHRAVKPRADRLVRLARRREAGPARAAAGGNGGGGMTARHELGTQLVK
jgi:hypothetical protein